MMAYRRASTSPPPTSLLTDMPLLRCSAT
jgi:hypothetical protein